MSSNIDCGYSFHEAVLACHVPTIIVLCRNIAKYDFVLIKLFNFKTFENSVYYMGMFSQYCSKQCYYIPACVVVVVAASAVVVVAAIVVVVVVVVGPIVVVVEAIQT